MALPLLGGNRSPGHGTETGTGEGLGGRGLAPSMSPHLRLGTRLSHVAQADLEPTV